jgi:hypothetical protein
MSIYILSTLAEVDTSSPLYPIRRSEYMLCLHKLLNYNYPTILIRSETERITNSCVHDILHKFTNVIDVPSTRKLGATYGKSQQEYVSIQSFINTNPSIDDDAWIIKVSGRYLFLDDTFVNHVKSASPEIQGVIKLCDNDTQMVTFCYALRYKWFKLFYKNPVECLGRMNIERFILICIQNAGIFANVIKVDRLGILANVNNENKFSEK